MCVWEIEIRQGKDVNCFQPMLSAVVLSGILVIHDVAFVEISVTEIVTFFFFFRSEKTFKLFIEINRQESISVKELIITFQFISAIQFLSFG